MEELIKNIYYSNYKEIMKFQKCLEEIWTDRVIKKFGMDSFRKIPVRKYLAPEGGYRIPENKWWELDGAQKDFFHDKVKSQNNYIYFRGYSYYSNDICLHKKEKKLNNKQTYSVLLTHWEQYKLHIQWIKKLKNDNLKWTEYLAIISFLEWMWNDISTLSWIALVIKEDSYEKAIMECIDLLASVIVNCTYYYLCAEEGIDLQLELGKLINIFSSENEKIIFGLLKRNINRNVYLFRTIREGDQLWIVLANYEFKLLPWLRKMKYPKVLFLNNAFGGINIGFFLKQLIKRDAESVNIYSSVHEKEMKRNVFWGKIDLRCPTMEYEYIIFVDDSIFTGKSLNGIKDFLEFPKNKMLYLPMTYDVATYFNHPEELGFSENNRLERVLQVEEMTRSISGILAPATSYWAYKKGEVFWGGDNEYDEKINGSDLLMRILWKRFEEEIKNEESY